MLTKLMLIEKGIYKHFRVAVEKCTRNDFFHVLRKFSQNQNLKTTLAGTTTIVQEKLYKRPCHHI